MLKEEILQNREVSFLEEVVSYIFIRIAVLLAIALYFLPTLVAKKENRGRAFIINLFIGWTFFGWVVAMIVGTQRPRRDYVVINNSPQSESEEEMRERIRKEEIIRLEEREKLTKNKID